MVRESRTYTLQEALSELTPDHSERLMWFYDRAGQEIDWPGELSDSRFLCSKQGGIFKPEGWKYALSVRQSKDPNYPDMEPIFREDGSWSYQYHQEKKEEKDFDKSYRNIALRNCMEDNIPVAVFRQISKKPAKYKVLGLARVDFFDSGYFHFEGYGSKRTEAAAVMDIKADKASDLYTERRVDVILESEITDYYFDPKSIRDGREKILASITRREGGVKFRKQILTAYSSKCAATGCIEESVLQAAHIKPYLGPETNHVRNGLLLRADIHTLFDRQKIAIDTELWKWIIHRDISEECYRNLDGQEVGLPKDERLWPNKMALDEHRHLCGI